MTNPSGEIDLSPVVEKIEQAAAVNKLSEGAVENLTKWLKEPRYSEYVGAIIDHVDGGKWQALDDAFWTVIPFGTGGRRGRMYPIGCNVINDRTIGESAQGLAEYVREHRPDGAELACAIAYDTRHNSRHFAELCAGIMVAAGYKVFFLDDYRSTPALSFLVRHKQCACGIMVTASHNPPSDNAVKVYGSTGGQVLPPHDEGIIQQVMDVGEIRHCDFQQSLQEEKIVICTDEIDSAFLEQVKNQRAGSGSRAIKVIYSPLHGVGSSAVVPVLEADGFTDVEVFGPHSEPSGDFPNVPGHVSNPENPAVFDSMIEHGQKVGADLILVTDPDCDRMGAAAPETTDPTAAWSTFTGNQLGALLTDYILDQRSGNLTPDHYVVKTLVTTEMIRRIADSYQVKTYGNLHVGFKWIAGQVDDAGPEKFVFGTEESHGYLVGTYARDKDGAVACMLMAELAAAVKAAGKSLHEKLGDLYWQHGYHAERTINVFMEGSEGMTRMQALMRRFRQQLPDSLAGLPVKFVRDYESLTVRDAAGSTEPLEAPRGDMVIIDFAEEGNYIAVRPSGTEPKVKFYLFTFVPAEQLADLELTKQELGERLEHLERDLRAFAL
jgi:phosphomannomutase